VRLLPLSCDLASAVARYSQIIRGRSTMSETSCDANTYCFCGNERCCLENMRGPELFLPNYSIFADLKVGVRKSPNSCREHTAAAV
jgi:hypothetical protein